MGGPALLQQLYAAIELREEPEHVVLESAQVVDDIDSWIGMDVAVFPHYHYTVYALLQLVQRLEHLRVQIGRRNYARLRLLSLLWLLLLSLLWLLLLSLLCLLRLLLLRWHIGGRGESDPETTHQVVDCGVDVLGKDSGVRLLLRIALLIGHVE